MLAIFANRHAAERMLASLGRDFGGRPKGEGWPRFLITGNADGSFSLVQSGC